MIFVTVSADFALSSDSVTGSGVFERLPLSYSVSLIYVLMCVRVRVMLRLGRAEKTVLRNKRPLHLVPLGGWVVVCVVVVAPRTP